MSLRPGSIHAAIIMDGNGRWANQRGLPRAAGHKEGANAVRRVVEAAPDLGIGTLTLYAFSEDNWQRPRQEVSILMRLLRRYLLQETGRCIANGVRVEVIGRRDRLSPALLQLIEETEQSTAQGGTLHLRLAIDYSARSAIVAAANHALESGTVTEEALGAALGPDVDLLIRTSGEQRLSDFLLWECAYAEFVFTDRNWPAFTAEDLAAAVGEFHARDRRFGAIPSPASRRSA